MTKTDKEMDEIAVHFERIYKLIELKGRVNDVIYNIIHRDLSFSDALPLSNNLFEEYQNEYLNKPEPNKAT